MESGNRQVEVAVDYDGFLDLCQKEGLPPEPTLLQFKERGVRAIAPSETTLEKLHQSGKLLWIRTEDLALYGKKYEEIKDIALAFQSPSIYVATQDAKLKKWLFTAIQALLGHGRERQVPGGFLVSGKWDDLTQMGLGIYPEQVKPLAALGFFLDPRISNRDNVDLRKLNYLLQNVASLPKVSTLIFSGLRNEVLGFDHEIAPVAEFLKTRGIHFGFVETYDPAHAVRGADDLAARIPDSVVKVQTLIFPPLFRFDPEKGVEIFSLGVRERNVRVVYFHPFVVNYEGKSLLQTNLDFLESLKADLEGSGFGFQEANPFPPVQSPLAGRLAAALGIAAAGFLFLLLFERIRMGVLLGGFVLVFFLALGFSFSRFSGLFESIMALLGALLFPVFGMVLFSQKKPVSFPKAVLKLTKVTLLTAGGGLLVSLLLLNNLSLLGIQVFRGVKVLFVVPVIFSLWFAWLRHAEGSLSSGWMKKAFSPFKEPFKVYQLLAVFLIVGAGAVMLIRSGNAVPEGAVPAWEKTLRAYLETTLLARPRFKEFVIGHPSFLLASTIGLEMPAGLFFFCLGSLGQADIMDSFAHLHTPLWFTLVRTVHGLWLGIMVGAMLHVLLSGIRRVAAKVMHPP